MKQLTRALCILSLSAIPVFPCGGPGSYPIDAPLVSVDRYLAAVEYEDASWDTRRRPELRFLHPFRGAPGMSEALWAAAYNELTTDSAPSFAEPDTVALGMLIRRGDRAAATRAAHQVVERILAMPAAETEPFNRVLRLATEWLDIENAVAREPVARVASVLLDGASATSGVLAEVVAVRNLSAEQRDAWIQANPRSVRRAALEFLSIRQAMQREIPDGWASQIRDSVPAATWRNLARRHEQWLASWGNHTVRPWVELSRARLAYFEGDAARAWEPLVQWYADGKYRTRVLSEMRYFVMQGVLPRREDRRIDPRLRAALLPEGPMEVATWNAVWRDARSLDDSTRIRTEERLLWRAAQQPLNDSLSLLNGFPLTGAAPTHMWARFRVLALARAGRRAEALQHFDAQPTDTVLAPLRAQLLLASHRWSDAIAAPLLPFEARQYLLRVMAPDSVVDRISKLSDRKLSLEARLTRAMREAGAGRWSEGAALLPRGDRRVALWQTAARLSADASGTGKLSFARWLNARHGTLFHGVDRLWYRSLNWRMLTLTSEGSDSPWSELLPWTREAEHAAIVAHASTAYERSIAIRVYAEWLKASAPGAERRRVLREANTMYNWLVNWDNNNSRLFLELMERDGTARAIREAGR